MGVRRSLLRCTALVAFASASAGTPPTLPLNDTGIETCYGASAPQSCAITSDYSRQDARFGRDPAYADGLFQKVGAVSAGLDYTKIANDGTELPEPTPRSVRGPATGPAHATISPDSFGK